MPLQPEYLDDNRVSALELHEPTAAMEIPASDERASDGASRGGPLLEQLSIGRLRHGSGSVARRIRTKSALHTRVGLV